MDFQKASGHLADSKIYIVLEGRQSLGEPWITAIFATYEAAESAAKFYRQCWSKYYYEIQEWEVLDQTPISKSEGPEAPAVGEGLDPEHIPEAGA